MSQPDFNQTFVTGSVETPLGPVPKISVKLDLKDHFGTIKARFGIGRMNYKVDPGLYAIGTPDGYSPLLVTANYKLSFDALRSVLSGRNLWVLVVDTDGVNVWCAAGKGSFSTDEVTRTIQFTNLDKIIKHRRVILPQLSAPGVAAHELKKLSGFQGIFGPIKARDLPAFIDSGLKTTTEMRTKTFSIWERILLIPIELISGAKLSALLALVFLFMTGFLGPRLFFENVWDVGPFVIAALSAALISGCVLAPIFLPWLPGRAFSLKGFVAGLIVFASLSLLTRGAASSAAWSWSSLWPWFLITPALSAYFAMNFTGCSTFTSLSGVKREMKFAMPTILVAFALGSIAWFGKAFIK